MGAVRAKVRPIEGGARMRETGRQGSHERRVLVTAVVRVAKAPVIDLPKWASGVSWRIGVRLGVSIRRKGAAELRVRVRCQRSTPVSRADGVGVGPSSQRTVWDRLAALTLKPWKWPSTRTATLPGTRATIICPESSHL